MIYALQPIDPHDCVLGDFAKQGGDDLLWRLAHRRPHSGLTILIPDYDPSAYILKISMKDRNVSVRPSDCFLQEGEVWAWGTFRDSSGPIGLMEEGQLQKTPLKVMPGVQVGDFQETRN